MKSTLWNSNLKAQELNTYFFIQSNVPLCCLWLNIKITEVYHDFIVPRPLALNALGFKNNSDMFSL